MIRRTGPDCAHPDPAASLAPLRNALLSRRRFLIQSAGGTVALLFGLRNTHAAAERDPWPTLDVVLRHLLPSEPGSPGAAEINALDYLRFVVDDPKVSAEDRGFIVQGSQWLNELAQQTHAIDFIGLDDQRRELLLRRTAASAAGENWLSTLISYLLESLLTAPAYGGNPDGIGWRWLSYVPGFPLPGAGTRYPELPL